MDSLKEGEWSCCRGGLQWRENSYVMEVVSLMEGERSLGGQFNGVRMVMLWRWPV